MNRSPEYWAELDRRYLAGETTLEEEKMLRAYWQAQDKRSPEGLMASYFDALAQEKAPEKLAFAPATKRTAMRKRIKLFCIAATAAVALLLVTNWSLFKPDVPTNGFPVEDWNPEIRKRPESPLKYCS